ncbi:unnamed protein product [Gordionus sp. m RMFG-2023]
MDMDTSLAVNVRYSSFASMKEWLMRYEDDNHINFSIARSLKSSQEFGSTIIYKRLDYQCCEGKVLPSTSKEKRRRKENCPARINFIQDNSFLKCNHICDNHNHARDQSSFMNRSRQRKLQIDKKKFIHQSPKYDKNLVSLHQDMLYKNINITKENPYNIEYNTYLKSPNSENHLSELIKFLKSYNINNNNNNLTNREIIDNRQIPVDHYQKIENHLDVGIISNNLTNNYRICNEGCRDKVGNSVIIHEDIINNAKISKDPHIEPDDRFRVGMISNNKLSNNSLKTANKIDKICNEGCQDKVRNYVIIHEDIINNAKVSKDRHNEPDDRLRVGMISNNNLSNNHLKLTANKIDKICNERNYVNKNTVRQEKIANNDEIHMDHHNEPDDRLDVEIVPPNFTTYRPKITGNEIYKFCNEKFQEKVGHFVKELRSDLMLTCYDELNKAYERICDIDYLKIKKGSVILKGKEIKEYDTNRHSSSSEFVKALKEMSQKINIKIEKYK